MKRLTLYNLILTIAFITTNINSNAQEVFGQDNIPNSTTPAVEIGVGELPDAVLTTLGRFEHSNWKLDKIYEVGKRTAHREDRYTVRFKRGDEYLDVYVDSSGNEFDPQDEKVERAFTRDAPDQ